LLGITLQLRNEVIIESNSGAHNLNMMLQIIV
jgi:hypothetical protein